MQTVELLGTRVTAATMAELNALAGEAVLRGERWVLANHNLHSIYLFQRDPKLRAFFSRAKIAHIDGMGVVFLARLFRLAVSREQRVTYVDWIRPFMHECQKQGWRVFFLGSRPGVGERAAELLAAEFPGVLLACHHGYFDLNRGSADGVRILAAIEEFAPQILMVGLGMPRQEHWILDHLDQLSANVVLPVGACMDYLAGVIPTSPRWMGRIGLEWLFRLVSEPRRLWKRYLVEPWLIGLLVARELLQKRP